MMPPKMMTPEQQDAASKAIYYKQKYEELLERHKKLTRRMHQMRFNAKGLKGMADKLAKMTDMNLADANNFCPELCVPRTDESAE